MNYFSVVAVMCVLGVFSLLTPIAVTANEGGSQTFACRYFSLILKPFGGCKEQIVIINGSEAPQNGPPIQTPNVFQSHSCQLIL